MVIARQVTVYTLGHSTRSAEEFLALLRAHAIARVVDVRSWPSSQRHPHFARDALATALAAAGVAYVWEPRLGGKRRPRPGDEVHTALAQPMFRAYVEHLDRPEAADAVRQLLGWAGAAPTAVMCAERSPERCHRQFLADRLVTLHGAEVVHLLDESTARPHRPTESLRVHGRHLVYDRAEQLPLV